MAESLDFSSPQASGWKHLEFHTRSCRLHYVRQGAGPVVILLHGWPEFWWTWHRNVPRLAQSFDVLAPDLRGFGQSEKPDGSALENYTVSHHVADLLDLVDGLKIERFGLVSHDVGAWVAQAFAREYPERLAGLFFTNCPYPGVGKRWATADHIPEIWYQSFNQQPWAAELLGRDRENCRLYFENMLSYWSYDPHAFDGQIEHWIDNFMQPGNLQGGFNYYIAQHENRMRMIRDGAPDLPPIEVPTRVLWGGGDRALKASWTDRLGDYFSDVRCDVHPQAGHFVHFEQADDVNGAILEFFDGRFTSLE